MSACKLVYYFSSHQAAFWLQPSLSPDNITLNPAKNSDQSFLKVDTDQLIYHIRVAHVDIIASIQGNDDRVIVPWEMSKFLTKIHDILEMLCLNGLVIQFIFWHLFLILLIGSVMKTGASQFPFFTTLRILFLLLSLQVFQLVSSTGLQTILTWIFPVFNLHEGYQGKAKGLIQV